MAGIPSLMSAQQAPEQTPGQAPMMTAPQQPQSRGVAPPIVGPLTQLHLDQLTQLMLNPRPYGPPLYAVLTAINEKQKQAQEQAAVQRQMAMSSAPQGTVKDAVVAQAINAPRYNTGGIVALQSGGALGFQTAGVVPPGLLNPDIDEEGLPRGKDEREQIIQYNERLKAAYQQQLQAQSRQQQAASARTSTPSQEDIAGRMAARRQQEQFYKPRDPNAYTPEMVGYKVPDSISTTPQMREGKAGNADIDVGPLVVAATPTIPPTVPQRRPAGSPGTTKPPATGIAAGIPPIEAADTRPDRLAEIEAARAKTTQGIQDLIRQQATVDPRVLEARKAAEDMAQSNILARQKALEEMLGTAKSATTAPLMDNQEALLRMAGALGGKKRFGEALSAASGAAGEVRGEQRKAYEKAQEQGRQEQILIGNAQQARKDLAVTQMGSDVDAQRAAARNVMEADAKLQDFQLNVAKERALEKDRAHQRESQRITALAHKLTAERGPQAPFQMQAIQRIMKDNPGMKFEDALKTFMSSSAEAKSVLTPSRLAGIRSEAERQATKDLSELAEYMKIKDPGEKQAYRENYIKKLVNERLAIAGYEVPEETTAPPKLPTIGEVRSGYRYKGGDPSNPSSWEKV